MEVDTQPDAFDSMIARTGRRSVPQIFIGGVHVGGYDELIKLDSFGKLTPMLNGPET